MAEVNPLDKIITANMDPDGGKKAPPRKKAVPAVKSPEPPEPVDPPKIKMEKFLKDQTALNQSVIDETHKVKVAKISTEGQAPDFPDVPLTPEEKMNLERVEQTPVAPETKPDAESSKGEKNIEDLKADLDAKRAEYARFDLDISGRWNKLKGLLGFNTKEIKDSGVEEKNNEYKAALKKYKDAKKANLGNLTKEQAAELLYEFKAGEALKFLEVKADESAKIKKEKGEWPESVMNGYMNIVKNFKSLSFKKKILISAGIMAGGAVAGMTFGVVGASVFTIAGAGYRAISGGATGLGLKKLMDTISVKREQKTSAKETEEILSQVDWLNQVNAELDEAVGTMDTRIGRMEGKDLTRKRIATFAGIFVGSGTMAYVINGTGLGGFLKDKIFGGGTQSLYPEGKYGSGGYGTENEGHGDIVKSTDERYGYGRYGAEGYATETEGHEDIIKSTHERYGYGKYGAEGHGTEAEGHINEFDEKYGPEKTGTEATGHVNEFDEKYGPEKTGTEQAGHVNEFDQEYGPNKTGTEAIGHQMDFKEISSGKFGPNGSVEGKIMQSIKMNPSAYGLDESDPNFSGDAQKMTRTISEEFAQRKGFSSYKEFDKYCRTHIQPNDQFRIIFNPNNDEIHLDYEGKAFGPNVFQVVPDEEISSSEGGKLAPEETSRPKAGAGAAEQQATRPSAAKAPESQFDADAYNEKGPQIEQGGMKEALAQVGPTRGLLNNIVTEAGVGNKGYFWGQPLSKFNELVGGDMIAQDASEMDIAEKTNLNKVKLRRLFGILKAYSPDGSKAIGQCLQEAIMDGKSLPRGASVGAFNLDLINQKVLGK